MSAQQTTIMFVYPHASPWLILDGTSCTSTLDTCMEMSQKKMSAQQTTIMFVYPHASPWLILDGTSCTSTLDTCMEMSPEISNLVKIWHFTRRPKYVDDFHCCTVHVPSIISLVFQLMHTFTHSFIYSFHLVVCLTTDPKPLPKPALHIVRSRASSFK